MPYKFYKNFYYFKYMSILFISDVHLSIKKPEITDSFFNFLNYHAIHAKALYILGDLFETWLGDDHCNIFHISIAHALKNLTKKNIPCYFINGNHDFLLGQQYANLCGMILLPAQKILRLPSGKKIVILHGDILCVNDISYLKFRKILLHFKIKKIFLSLPLYIRTYIFNTIQFYCSQFKKNKKNDVLNIDSQTVTEILIKNKAEIMIHGHTHQLAIYKILYSTEHIFSRIVLGKWEKYGSVIEISERNTNITLVEFPLKKCN